MRTTREKLTTVKPFGLLLAMLLCIATASAEARERSTTRLEVPGIAGGTAVLEFSAAPLVSMTTIPFRLELKRADGSPLTGADVACDLTMPAMPMPENRPAAREMQPGNYRGEAVFTMAGAWQAACAIELPAGGKEILLFDIKRVLLK